MVHAMGSTSPRAHIQRFAEVFSARAAHIAIRDVTGHHAYGTLATAALECAARLRAAGLQPGDRVACLATPSARSVQWMLGCYEAALVYVPINTRYKAAEIAHILEDSGAAALLLDENLAALADALPQASTDNLVRIPMGDDASSGSLDASSSVPALFAQQRDDALAMLIYTSGTTGPSKGVMLDFQAVLSNMRALTSAWRFAPTDVLVLALPLFHVHGLCIGVHGGLMHGMTLHLMPTFDANAILEALADDGTIFMGVPTMYARLVARLDEAPARGQRLRRVRLFTSGSAALSPALARRFHELTGHEILERYGMSETLITLTNPYDGPRQVGAVGHPVPGVETRVVDEAGEDVAPGTAGELLVRGGGMMRGYWNLPDATTQAFRAGWFATGDLVARARDGAHRILGRMSVDIIKSGGFKISAGEIEEVLRAAPGVTDAAVVGVEDPEWGERIVAFVEGATPEPEALQRHCRAQLADYKCPRAFVHVDSLPRNALGKLQKHRLKTRAPS